MSVGIKYWRGPNFKLISVASYFFHSLIVWFHYQLYDELIWRKKKFLHSQNTNTNANITRENLEYWNLSKLVILALEHPRKKTNTEKASHAENLIRILLYFSVI